MTETDGKGSIGTTSPISLLHILGSRPPISTLAGTSALEALRITGAKGGDRNGSGRVVGNGSSLFLQAGDGGDERAGFGIS